jgi:hypothetical protein
MINLRKKANKNLHTNIYILCSLYFYLILCALESFSQRFNLKNTFFIEMTAKVLLQIYENVFYTHNKKH